jgi:hypothetical protein
MSEKKCYRCGQKGEYKTVVYRSAPKTSKVEKLKLRKRTEYVCLTHYMEGHHGLWPFRCVSKTCFKKLSKEVPFELLQDDPNLTVWLNLDVIVSRPKARRPTCPLCQRPMAYLKAKQSEH